MENFKIRDGRKCVGFSVGVTRTTNGEESVVLRLHPRKKDSDRADLQYPAASIALERKQAVDLIVWLARALNDRCPSKEDADG